MGRTFLAIVLLFGCGRGGGGGGGPQFTGLVAVSGLSPFPEGCATVPGRGGVLYRNAEVEPQLAVNPTDPSNLVAVWQQDRWSNGGSRGIVTAFSTAGGQSWSRVLVPFTTCAGGDFERASDPWVTFARDGTVHQIAYGFDQSRVHRAMLVTRSSDGGRNWTKPVVLQDDTDADFVMDKESITADATDASRIYAVWDRLTGATMPDPTLATGPTWFSRSLDRGLTWQTRQIYDPGADAQTISNEIVVLPSCARVNLFVGITQNSTRQPVSTLEVLRSTDRGDSWSQPLVVDRAEFVGAIDPKNGKGIRTGSVVPSVAVDETGTLYVAWADARFSNFQRDAIVLSRSIDGGQTWSAQPVQVNQAAPGAQAFTPVVSAAAGAVAVTFYDLRNDDADPSHLYATAWLAISTDGGQTFRETQMTPRFDLSIAPDAGGYFLGDYHGLARSGSGFVALFAAAHDGESANRTDIFFRPANAPRVGSEPVAQAALSLFRGARERWRFDTLFK